MCAESLQSCLTCATPGTVARQAPLSMGFSRQGYWSGLPFPPPGDLPMPGMELTSLLSPALAGKFFTTSAAWEATQRLKKPQESDTGWLTTRYYIYRVSSTTSARDSIWGHTLIQTTPGKLVLVTGTWATQVMLVVKNLPANAGDLRDVGSIPGLGRSPGGGHSLHFSILAWGIRSWTEELGGLQSMGSRRVRHY